MDKKKHIKTFFHNCHTPIHGCETKVVGIYDLCFFKANFSQNNVKFLYLKWMEIVDYSTWFIKFVGPLG
jgi:hypothetical protein